MRRRATCGHSAPWALLLCGLPLAAGTPTANPSGSPSMSPTISPTMPTGSPTTSPSTSPPTVSPTMSPTVPPSTSPPSTSPTFSPTVSPTRSPTKNPSASPTRSPTRNPSASPTFSPSTSPPSRMPSANPTLSPTLSPTDSRERCWQYTCPSGFAADAARRYSVCPSIDTAQKCVAGHISNTDTCCRALCGGTGRDYSCPDGSTFNALARTVPCPVVDGASATDGVLQSCRAANADNTDTCCNAVCAGAGSPYACPANFVLRDDPDSLLCPQKDNEVPTDNVVATCKPGNFDNDDTCCQAACSGYTCPAGYTLNTAKQNTACPAVTNQVATDNVRMSCTADVLANTNACCISTVLAATGSQGGSPSLGEPVAGSGTSWQVRLQDWDGTTDSGSLESFAQTTGYPGLVKLVPNGAACDASPFTSTSIVAPEPCSFDCSGRPCSGLCATFMAPDKTATGTYTVCWDPDGARSALGWSGGLRDYGVASRTVTVDPAATASAAVSSSSSTSSSLGLPLSQGVHDVDASGLVVSLTRALNRYTFTSGTSPVDSRRLSVTQIGDADGDGMASAIVRVSDPVAGQQTGQPTSAEVLNRLHTESRAAGSPVRALLRGEAEWIVPTPTAAAGRNIIRARVTRAVSAFSSASFIQAVTAVVSPAVSKLERVVVHWVCPTTACPSNACPAFDWQRVAQGCVRGADRMSHGLPSMERLARALQTGVTTVDFEVQTSDYQDLTLEQRNAVQAAAAQQLTTRSAGGSTELSNVGLVDGSIGLSPAAVETGTASNTSSDDDDGSGPWWLWLLFALALAGCLLFLIIVLWLCCRKRSPHDPDRGLKDEPGAVHSGDHSDHALHHPGKLPQSGYSQGYADQQQSGYVPGTGSGYPPPADAGGAVYQTGTSGYNTVQRSQEMAAPGSGSYHAPVTNYDNTAGYAPQGSEYHNGGAPPPMGSSLQPGGRVDAYHGGEWWPATVHSVEETGAITVNWYDGTHTPNMDPTLVRERTLPSPTH
eukprot:TRINITY_DN6811_c0_g1_i2.p1 TRINITY_DN6811_c0_g1~~TRINITY_DN6811_c0_g1_i2.p1  ORF type:complete len:1031 (+),score=117.85 TRINITY_DN6811_c0_g1_i2:93-3095(+)